MVINERTNISIHLPRARRTHSRVGLYYYTFAATYTALVPKSRFMRFYMREGESEGSTPSRKDFHRTLLLIEGWFGDKVRSKSRKRYASNKRQRKRSICREGTTSWNGRILRSSRGVTLVPFYDQWKTIRPRYKTGCRFLKYEEREWLYERTRCEFDGRFLALWGLRPVTRHMCGRMIFSWDFSMLAVDL